MTGSAVTNVQPTVLLAADKVAGKAVGPWVKAGPKIDANGFRELFGSGVLDGGVGTIEACMTDFDVDPNETAPAADEIFAYGLDAQLDNFAVRSRVVFLTKAHWIRVVVTGAGAALSTKWWVG